MKAILVAGLGFGDEGKGSIVDSLVRQTGATLVVRYNGGCQAAHHVVTAVGREHCFAQFGSGTLAGARTHLSRFMMIHPLGLIREARHLETLGVIDPLSLLTIDPGAPIITPYHAALNRLREVSRGDQKHGSCGQGIGELASDLANQHEYLTAGHLWGDTTSTLTVQIVERVRERLSEDAKTLTLPNTDEVHAFLTMLHQPTLDWLKQAWPLHHELRLSDKMVDTDLVVFEGAQGVLLDEKHGFQPHTTWSNCTYENALTLLNEHKGEHDIQRIGVTRAYHTRHGAGPFPTEDASVLALLDNEHNGMGRWQGPFRAGHLDLTLLQYAYNAIKGCDMLAVTCVDHIAASEQWKACINYEANWSPIYRRGKSVEDLLHLIESSLDAPIGIVSTSPTAVGKAYILAEQLEPGVRACG